MIVCPACGQENPPAARYCNSCGASLEELRAAPTRARKTVTIVFTDVVGSTSIGERLDPEAVRAVMARYFGTMRACLERHGGTVEKFIGDAVMAVFGIPTVHEDDALRAVRAAADMRTALDDLNADLDREWGIRIENRTGINTGEVVVGEVGSGSTLATGDAVNVAARLEQAAGTGEILLGELTQRLSRDSSRVEPVEPVPAKGKTQPVRAFRLLDVHTSDDRWTRGAHLVGRAKELQVLREAFETVEAERRPRIVSVVGFPGVGKSRLAREALREVEAKVRTLRGRCLPYGEGITFWPVAEAFRQAAEVQESDPPDVARDRIVALAEGHPQAGRVGEIAALAAGVGAGSAPAPEIAWGIREVLMNLARSRPTILLLDDIQWGEQAFLDLVASLAESREGAALLVLCLARPELDDVRPDWSGVSTILTLDPLRGRDTEELVASLIGAWGIPDDARTRIASAAGGNPLFVEELVEMLVEDGLLRRDEMGAWRIRDLDRLQMPATIGALLSARLERLSEPERRTAELASVIGEEFSKRAVKALTGSEIDADAALDGLMRRDLIKGSNGDVRFRHILIRDAAYAGLPKQARAELHESYASWLENDAGERATELEEILGHHLEQAYRYLTDLRPLTSSDEELGVRAAHFLGSAGRRATDRGDVSATVNLLQRAVELLPAGHPSRVPMQLSLCQALFDHGQLQEALDTATDVRTEAEAAGDEVVAAQADLQRAEAIMSLESEPNVEIERRARAAIELFERVGGDQDLARAWFVLGLVAWGRCRFGDSAEAMTKAVEHARRAGNHADEVRAREWMTFGVMFGPTPSSEGIARMEAELSNPGSRTLEGGFHWTRGGLLAMQGRFEEARASLAVARRIYDELGYTIRNAAGAQAEGLVESLAGDEDAAIREHKRSCDLLKDVSDVGFRSTSEGYLAGALCNAGRYDEAGRAAGKARKLAAPDDLISQYLWRSALARVAAHTRRIAEALELVEEAVRLSLQSDNPNDQADAEMDRAEILEIAGRMGEAREAIERAIGHYGRKENLVSASRARERLRDLSASSDRR